LSWKNILKNVITQGRVKEIEDIDIDIEEDDCRRWLKQFIDIIKSYSPTVSLEDETLETTSKLPEDFTEEEACSIKYFFCEYVKELRKKPYGMGMEVEEDIEVSVSSYRTFSLGIYTTFGYTLDFANKSRRPDLNADLSQYFLPDFDGKMWLLDKSQLEEYWEEKGEEERLDSLAMLSYKFGEEYLTPILNVVKKIVRHCNNKTYYVLFLNGAANTFATLIKPFRIGEIDFDSSYRYWRDSFERRFNL